jgi:hypothetical protein
MSAASKASKACQQLVKLFVSSTREMLGANQM